MEGLTIRSFLSLSDIPLTKLFSLIEKAQFYSKQNENPQKLKNKIIVNAFYEASTRTRISFEVAALKMGAQVINFAKEQSSAVKGETVYDTLKTMESHGVDALILRHEEDHLCFELAPKFKIPLINAGAGKREHPSQTLLDLVTLKDEFNHLEGLTVGIIGDITHSRVANGFIQIAQKCGIKILVSGPVELIPTNLKITPMDILLAQVDAVMCLRYQLERMEKKIELSEFHQTYGLTETRAKLLSKHAIIMHPAPINRDIEIASSLIESSQSRIFKQMQMGVFARMSILDFIFEENL